MKRISLIFLQVITVFIAVSIFALMLWEPHLEGRNVNSTLFEIYFKDPFLAYAYFASISFYLLLYQIFKLLGFIRQNKLFSTNSVRALKTIKYCAIALATFVFGAEAYFFIIQRTKEDIAGGVAMGLFIFFFAALIGIAATVCDRIIQNALENEL